MIRSHPYKVVSIALASVLAAALLHPATTPVALGKGRYRTTSRTIAPGLVLVRMTDASGPNEIRALKIDPSKDLTIDVALANNEIPGHETTSSMAARHRAVAAMNGDYTIRPFEQGAGRPVDIFAEDGELHASPLIWGRQFAIRRDEKQIFIRHTRLSMWVTQRDSNKTWTIDRWNELRARPGELAVYTPEGGATYRPPRRACAARLYPRGNIRWFGEKRALERDYRVDRVVCSADRLQRRGGIVIATRSGTETAVALRRAITKDETLRLGWATGWPGIVETIGGNPNLVADGKIVAPGCSTYFCDRHPRSGVGVTSSGRVLFVTVDGRAPGYSVGMTLVEFARLFKRLGATWALNLDGGGSTTMVVRGAIVNRPSDSSERPVGSALLVLPGKDRGEREPASDSPPPLVPLPKITPNPARLSPACAALLDAGSTGGLLDAVARGELGAGPRRLPADLAWALGSFRSRSC